MSEAPRGTLTPVQLVSSTLFLLALLVVPSGAAATGSAATTTTLRASLGAVSQGQTLTLTAAVTGSGAAPTGTVTFLYNGSTLGATTLTDGTAQYQTSGLPAGYYSLTAVYSGDSSFAGSASAPISEAVEPPARAWGFNQNGQLGNHTTSESRLPAPVSGTGYLTAITGGEYHSLAIESDGAVWAWGLNAQGQLGNDSATDSAVPVQVSGLSNVIAISGGAEHSLALKSDGTVWAWGYNAAGQLGANATTNSHVPVQTRLLSNMTAIAAGALHSLAVKSDGTVWGWGSNGNGQLGNNSTSGSQLPVQVPGLSNVTAVAGGALHSLALKSDGSVWAWGYNSSGELGNNSTTDSHVPVQVSGLSNVTAIVGGAEYSLALKNDGTVWTWGNNKFGQLGNNSTTDSHVPVQVQGLSNVTAIAGGGYHSLALKSDGTAWAWGDNTGGNLGNNSATESDVPVQVQGLSYVTNIASGWYHSLAIVSQPLLAVSGFISPVIAGNSGAFTVQAVDANGNPWPNYTGTIHFTSSDPSASLPPDYTFVPGDQSSHTFAATLKTAPTQTITATDTATKVSGFQGGLLVNPGSVTHLRVSAPSSAVAGNAVSITVLAADSFNNTVPGYTGTIHFTSSDLNAVLPVDYTFAAGDSGSKTFNLTLNTAGTQTVSATDTSNSSISGVSGSIAVSAGTATHLGVSVPATTTAGASQSVTITALDASNNTSTGYRGTVHFISSDSESTLPADYPFTSTDNGAHTFTATLRTAGSQTITTTDTLTSSITGSASITVNPGAGSELVVRSFPNPAIAGAAGTFTVAAFDSVGNIATGYAGTLHFTSSDPNASLPQDYTFASSDNGVHSFSATLNTVGTQSITATDTITGSISSSQGGIAVNPGAGSHLVVTAPPSSAAGNSFSIIVTVKDSSGNVATGYTGTLHFTSTDPKASLPADYPFTTGAGNSAADNGVHTFSVTLNTAGIQAITGADISNNSINGAASGIVVIAGPSTHLRVSASATATAGTPVSVSITAQDASNNTATGYAGAVHFTSSDANAVLPGDYTFTTADAGSHTFAVVLNTAGSQTITTADTVTGVSGSQSGISVVAGSPTNLLISAPANAAFGVPFTVTVTAQDAQHNTVKSYTGQVHFSATGPAAGLPADYQFMPSDQGVRTFTVTLFQAGSEIVTVSDTAGFSVSATIPVAPPVHTFQGGVGWQLVSAPYSFNQKFIDSNVYAAVWQPAFLQYAITPIPPADTFHLGQGLWMFIQNDFQIFQAGIPADTTNPFSIPLQTGWNMVGDPFTGSVPLSGLVIADANGIPTPFSTAVTNGAVSPLYAYDVAGQQYVSVQGDAQVITPWTGYWLYSFNPGSLVVSPPSTGPPPGQP